VLYVKPTSTSDKLDQSALTGESLPVSKKEADEAYSGSIVNQGEMIAVVTATGSNTYFGRTAKLVAGSGSASHFQQAVERIGNSLIVLAVFLAVVLTPIMIIALALLDDVPIMTIAFDNARVSPKPVRWRMHQVLPISSVLGLLAVIQSFGLLYLGDTIYHLDQVHLRTMMFLQLVAGGHLMLFVMRTPKAFWLPPYPNAKLFFAIVATQIAAVFMCAEGWLVPALPWNIIGLVWVYNLAWMVVQDIVKLGLYRFMGAGGLGRVSFLRMLGQPLGGRTAFRPNARSLRSA
jgi:magnesium-transporting ATPase (P-type)